MPQSIPIAFKPIGTPTVGHNNYQGFQPGKTEVLPKGWNGYNAKALVSDIVSVDEEEISQGHASLDWR